jgi:predicted transposase YbfD/YdcC
MSLSLATVFADVPDPRRDTKNKHHLLTDILTIATCAVIAGAEGWEQIAEYGEAKEPFFRQYLEFPNGIPSYDTFYRVFTKLDPEAFVDRFGRWMARVCAAAGLSHVAIDGKSARRNPKGTFSGCLHLVEAWAVEDRLILGQRSVPEGGHEIATIRDLLGALDLTGAVVTVDAAGCQKATVEQMAERGVRGVREGEPEGVAGRGGGRVRTSRGRGVRGVRHGRAGGVGARARGGAVRDDGGEPDRVAVGLDRCGRGGTGVPGPGADGEAEREHEPLLPDELAGGRVGAGGLHSEPPGHRERVALVLDVAFREDESRTRAGHAGANLGMIRRVALSLLKRTGTKGSIQTRRMRAGWGTDCLIKVLQGITGKDSA